MTGRFDEHPIKDKIAGVTFSFYTSEEIKKLSVQQIVDPVAFDHLNNPTKQGLHDKYLGVSPFDHKSTCPTCGMTVNYCPGHVGHIELTAPIYNPFLFKDAYKLLKAKCFGCHRMRIHQSKQEAYVCALKLLKAGDIIHSSELKSYLLYAAKAITFATDTQLTDQKFLKTIKSGIEQQAKGFFKLNIDQIDMPNFVTKMENAINERKENHEEKLKDMFKEICEGYVDLVSTSSAQKAILDLLREIWSSVVTTTCPHCKHKSPAVKKDGYTKLFIKPLQGQAAITARQGRNVRESGKKSRDSSLGDSGFEILTNATTSANDSRKQSTDAASHEDLDVEQDEEGVQSSEDEEYKEGTPQRYITPIEVQDHLSKLWAKDGALLDLIYGRFDGQSKTQSVSLGSQMFFLNQIVVPPTRFRPESEGGLGGTGHGDKAYLHTHSAMLTRVIQENIKLSEALLESHEKQTGDNKPQNATQKWIMLQDAVNIFMDATMAQKTADKQQQGIRQLLEKKEGMFRMKMMGKRVNFGGRSVISPDPMIKTDQIGIPIFMAKKLTFPESVANVNSERLAQLVRNGSAVHPGANIVEDEESGKQILLSHMSYEEREGVANQLLVGRKIVHRHLTNGDVLLVNRQPTLHKPSIMAHLARILPKEQTIRMHYANCSTYNADFDGDEMNIHLPQSYHAASEAYKLMATHKQYVVPTSGKPIRGLIQDSVVSGVFLTSKDTFLTREEYMQLVYIGLRELIEDGKLQRIKTMPPQIMKPKKLWTGKQVISTILKNIVICGMTPKEIAGMKGVCGMNLESKARLAAKEWGPLGKEEGEVIIRDNEHLVGTMDKNQFGANDQGMVHSFYEIYGSEKAGELLTSLARIFVGYLQTHGFTCGLDDLAIKPEYNKQRRMTIEKGHMNGVIAAAKFADMSTYNIKNINYSNRIVYQSDRRKDTEIEKLNQMSLPDDPFDIAKKCIQADDPIKGRVEDKVGQSTYQKDQLETELDNIMKSTMSQATSTILKECIPDGLIKRFPKNNISAMVNTGAKGGAVNQTQISALLGQQELEGRRVPRMANGKTLPCYLSYDPNPRASGYISDRFLTGLRPQDFYFHCMAGREGLIDTAVKTSRSGYLQRCLIKQLESLVVAYDLTVRDNDGAIVQFTYGDDGIDVMENKFLNKFKFLEQNHTIVQRKVKHLLKSGAVEIEPIIKAKQSLDKQVKKLMKGDAQLTEVQAKQAVAEPLLSRFHPHRHFGSISEEMEQGLFKYIKYDSLAVKTKKDGDKAPIHKFPIIESETFQKLYYWKYLKSLVHPGENVGTIAAQSIGEPSTQMTLNTFHLAGHGAANMTLGMPRMKEILMTTPTNIKTPCMTVFFQKGLEMDLEQMGQIASNFQRIKFSDVVKAVHLGQSINKGVDGNYSRIYKLKLEFDDAKKLKSKLGIKFSQLCKVFSDKFVPFLMTETLKEVRRSTELEMKGHKNQENQTDLKKILAKTVKATKVTKGQEEAKGEKDPEEQLLIEDPAAKDSEEDDSIDDMVMDLDGNQKTKVTTYGNSDSEDPQQAVDESDIEEPEEKEHIMHGNILREKHAKYLHFLKGDFEFENNLSASMTLQFPLEYKKLLLLTIAENVLKKTLVRNIQGIEKCILVQPQKQGGEPYLFVQGLSFEAFDRYPAIFDLRRIQTNHSFAMIGRYGIEACRANIVKEIKAVFDVYGIAVDYRHLSLIGDFITYNGEYRAFNRIGMEESNSPFLKMSYETTMKYLIQSSVTNDTDWMKSPSSALVLGQAPNIGSNVFDLIQAF